MLTANEALIRDVVRLDASAPATKDVANLPGVVEMLASRLISQPDATLEGIIVDGARNGVEDPDIQLSTPTPRLVGEGSLGNRLANVHQQELGTMSVESALGIEARRGMQQALFRLGLVTNTTLPLSAVFLKDPGRYISAVGKKTPRELGALIDQCLPEAVTLTDSLLSSGRKIVRGWADRIVARQGTVMDVALTQIARWPATDSRALVAATGVNKSNVYRALDHLVDAGILKEVTGRGKNRVWVAPALHRLIARELSVKP